MKARKLPSGSWRCRVYDYTDENGVKKYKSFTCNDPTNRGKKKCEAMAAEWSLNKKEESYKGLRITFDDALKQYLDSRRSVLSASTIREYERYVKNGIQIIGKMYLDEITQQDIQAVINSCAIKHAPKTVKNLHGIISPVMKAYRPDFFWRVQFPQPVKVEKYIPTKEEMQAILREVEGTYMEIPVLLGMYGIRRSEICGLEYQHISGNYIHICQSKVRGPEEYELKKPKTVTSDRGFFLPDFIIEKINAEQNESGFVTDRTPAAITEKFKKICLKLGIDKKMTFHGLRHYLVSTLHEMDIPDADIIKMTGHSSVSIMQNVYLHGTKKKIDEMNTKANEYFSELYDTKYDTKK